jgi:ComF family protein
VVPARLPQWTTAHIAVGVSSGRYEGALRDVIHAFKYQGRRSLADPLGRLLRDTGRELLDDCDYVVPVPLHPWRRLRRGFNQARDLAARLDRPVVDALWRVRATPSQMTLSADGRRTNVRDAFIASPFANIDDRVVVLVDDVRTTGATLDECAKELLRTGAREVRALTIAIAEKSVMQEGVSRPALNPPDDGLPYVGRDSLWRARGVEPHPAGLRCLT